MNGFLPLLKPPGMTSSDAVLAIRKRLPKGTRVGHAGTLDPNAAGVLPIMIGKATRLFDYLADKQKEYIAEWVPGLATDTLDVYGKELSRKEITVDKDAFVSALAGFRGDIRQIPPMVSALKRDGMRLYNLARSGQVIGLPARTVHIQEIRLLRMEPGGRAWLRVICGKGTYIRSLCRDIGDALHCDACMGALIRTKVGCFSIGDSSALEELTDEATIQERLVPMDLPLLHLPRFDFAAEQEKRVRNGNPVPAALPENRIGIPLRLYLKDEFCGIGVCNGDTIRFLTMLCT